MQYYYLKNRLRYGPVKFEELKSKDIKKDTLVWYEGLKDWTKAGEIKELKEEGIETQSIPWIDSKDN